MRRPSIERRLNGAARESTLGAKTPVTWRLDEEPTGSDVFLTRDEALIGVVSDAIETVAGRCPALSTSGGTSDARFIRSFCPVVEFGPVGATMHQVDEHVPVADIVQTTAVYERILDAYFSR